MTRELPKESLEVPSTEDQQEVEELSQTVAVRG